MQFNFNDRKKSCLKITQSKSIWWNANGNNMSFLMRLEHFFGFSIRFFYHNNEKVMNRICLKVNEICLKMKKKSLH